MERRAGNLGLILLSVGLMSGAFLLLCSTPVARAQGGSNQDAELVVGIIQGPKFDGAICTRRRPEDIKEARDQFVFRSDLAEYEKNAQMNIEGKDVDLKLVAQRDGGKDPNHPTAGDRSTREYAAGDLKVRVDYLLVATCPPDERSCESLDYDATITVSRGTKRTIVKTSGACGS